MNPDELSKKLLKKASERKSSETFDQTTQRVGDVLDRRNKAMEKIEKYQEKHGTPSQEEANDSFIKDEAGLGISMNDLESLATSEE